ncbi:hypothetical protein BT96DRAFT_994906 [Gymnopus androsaceus JB14]|uniref:Uncharacterized protein n=1 Tax=Gymnopus androsaceus JB14 TaxID=1447944 RepID=A0A6A4HLZ1_9AGAR|nr:hypothetical protein BT96DRAFT_994906 [Gymnopus androsaceus JB14]
MAKNPLAKLLLKGSGKGPKFPEYVTGQCVKDFIDDVEELVSDVPEITSDAHKKEALIRYLSSEVKRTWKAIEGDDGVGSYKTFKENVLASYDHTETASIKKLDEVLKGYKHLAANANPIAVAAVDPQGHKPSEDDPIGLDELLEELELQARVHDSETSVMGMHIQEQRDNDMAQLRDVLVNQQRDYDRRHKELLDVVVKLAQEVKVAPAYQQRTYNNTPSTYQPQQPQASGPTTEKKKQFHWSDDVDNEPLNPKVPEVPFADVPDVTDSPTAKENADWTIKHRGTIWKLKEKSKDCDGEKVMESDIELKGKITSRIKIDVEKLKSKCDLEDLPFDPDEVTTFPTNVIPIEDLKSRVEGWLLNYLGFSNSATLLLP